MPQRWPDELRREALALAAIKGPRPAARELGIPQGTLTRWWAEANRATRAESASRSKEVKRDERGRILPGYSGNPAGGLPSAVREAKRRAEQKCPEAIDMLWALASDPKTPVGTRVVALDMLLDRGMGKPRQSIDFSGEVTQRYEYDITQRILADPEALELAGALLERAAGPDAGPLCLDGERREVEAL